MKFEDILSELNKKIYHPIYFLMGDESYFIDEISKFILTNILSESEKEFNQTILYGKDINIEDVISQAKRFPLIGNHNVLVIKEAQHIKNIEKLELYINQPQLSTILVICYKNKTLDKRKKITKLLSEKGVLFESKKLYDYQVSTWIERYVNKKKHSIKPKAIALLSEYLGTNLNKLSNELNKLMLVIEENQEIDADIIQDNIGISKDFNNFELTNALSKKNVLKSNLILNYFNANQKNHPLTVTIIVLFNFFQKTLIYHNIENKSKKNISTILKINPFFVKDYEVAAKNYSTRKLVSIISFLREYDLKSKGVNNTSTSNGELLKELVYKILH